MPFKFSRGYSANLVRCGGHSAYFLRYRPALDSGPMRRFALATASSGVFPWTRTLVSSTQPVKDEKGVRVMIRIPRVKVKRVG